MLHIVSTLDLACLTRFSRSHTTSRVLCMYSHTPEVGGRRMGGEVGKEGVSAREEIVKSNVGNGFVPKRVSFMLI